MDFIDAAKARSASIRADARRFKLLFVQMGAAFSPLRAQILLELDCATLTAREFCDLEFGQSEIAGMLLLTDLEEFVDTGMKGHPTLGTLRSKVLQQLEKSDVCLLSRSPRSAFPKVPGSSLIEDATVHRVPLLKSGEHPFGPINLGAEIPAAAIGNTNFSEIFENVLTELGLSTLAALDYAVYESMGGRQFPDFLQPGEVEAMRCAGIVELNGEGADFTVPQRFSEFKHALDVVLSRVTEPQEDLDLVMKGLWTIERLIRKSIRDEAWNFSKGSWRKNVANKDLLAKALDRAKIDSYPAAKNISELRDPLEWLSLGELLEIVNSSTFGGLGVARYSWERFRIEILPIRNRISHMRLIKKEDLATVNLWKSQLRRML